SATAWDPTRNYEFGIWNLEFVECGRRILTSKFSILNSCCRRQHVCARRQVRAEDEANHQRVAVGPGVDSICAEVRVVRAPACGVDARVHVPNEAIADGPMIRPRTLGELRGDRRRIARPDRLRELTVEEQPAAVLR